MSPPQALCCRREAGDPPLAAAHLHESGAGEARRLGARSRPWRGRRRQEARCGSTPQGRLLPALHGALRDCGMPASGRLRLWASPHPGPWRTPWVSGPLALNRGGGGACALSAGRRTTAGRTSSLPEAGVKQRRSSVASSPPPLPASPQGPSSEKRGGLGGAAAPAGNSHSTAREAPPVSIATCREEFPGLQTLSQ